MVFFYKNMYFLTDKKFWYLLPLLMPTALLMFAVVTLSLLLVGQLRTELVWPLGIVAALAGCFVVYTQYEVTSPTRMAATWSVVVVGLSIIWAGFNAYYSSEHIYVDRDPGIYGQAAAWLVDHTNMQMPKSALLENDPALTQESPGFRTSLRDESELFTQGTHVLPAMIALVGRVLGIETIYRTNPLISAFAFMAFFSFARLFVKHKWAFIATAALAISLPAIYFSRDIYTEMLMLTSVFTAATLFAAASLRPRAHGLWVLAGIVAGSAVMVRIDAFIPVIGIVLAFITVSMLQTSQRKQYVLSALLFLTGFGTTVSLGMLDLYQLSSGYFSDLYSLLRLELIFLATVLVVGAGLTMLAWRTSILQWLNGLTSGWRAKVVAGGAVLVYAILATRPLWLTDRVERRHQAVQGLVTGIQVSEGSVIDAYRTYAEMTINWVAWYIGPVLAICAAIGIYVLLLRAMRSRDIKWLLAALVVLGTGLLYLNKPSITPDQLWASRRLLPVVLPGFALLGVIGLEFIEKRKKLPLEMTPPVLTGVLATLALVGPLFISFPFLMKREYVPQVAQVTTFCGLLPKDSVVLWVGVGKDRALRPTTNFCNVPTAGIQTDSVSSDEVTATIARISRSGRVPVIAGLGDKFFPKLGLGQDKFTETSGVSFVKYNIKLSSPPRTVLPAEQSIYLAIGDEDGSVTPLKLTSVR